VRDGLLLPPLTSMGGRISGNLKCRTGSTTCSFPIPSEGGLNLVTFKLKFQGTVERATLDRYSELRVIRKQETADPLVS